MNKYLSVIIIISIILYAYIFMVNDNIHNEHTPKPIVKKIEYNYQMIDDNFYKCVYKYISELKLV